MSKTLFLSGLFVVFGVISCAAQSQPPEPTTVTKVYQKTRSNADFATTNSRLKTAIESRGLIIFATVDHAAGASKVGQTLAPNTLYIFGNPQAGTPLMLANPDLGIDLPLKAHIQEIDGEVFITTSDIKALTTGAGVTEPAPVIAKIGETLDAITKETAGAS